LEYVRGQLTDGDTTGAQQRLGQALTALNTTIRDIRSYILDLRPRHFDGNDLASGLKQLLAEFKANTLMQVELHADPAAESGLTPDTRRALFHITQEALSNAARHSRASRLAIRLIDEGERILLSIRDNGKGFNPDEVQKRVGHGLMNMRDRAAAAGGELFLELPPEGGVDVRVRVRRRD
jgi:signal transduction histidine kinase